VARDWLQIKVELLGGGGIDCDPPPGRVFIVGPGQTFASLAEAINMAFARWDLSHLHGFELPDGRLVGAPDPESDENEWLDHAAVTVTQELAPGDAFLYTFDFGDDWQHRCLVLPDKVDAREVSGELPRQPVAIDGWGWIPDQYGRESPDDDE
jgi:hypothetical protein